MFTSEVQVANFALDLLGEAEIQALTENNPAARALNRQIHLSRDIVLAESNWKFAQTSKALSNDATAPVHPRWTKRSALPGKMIKLIHLWDGDPDNVDSRPLPEESWEIEGAYLMHDLTYPTVTYLSSDTNFGGTVSRWTPKAAEAWAYHLAASVGKKIQGNEQMARALMSAYIQDRLPTARMKEGHQGRVNENMSIHKRLRRSPLVSSRVNNRILSS